MDADSNKKDAEYEVYLDERRTLIEAEQKGAQQFDKAILTLGAGALAISLTFIKNIAPNPQAWTIIWLASAWIAFILSLLSTLCSFLTSQSACRKQIDILENDFLSSNDPKKSNNKFAVWTNRLNIFSIISFILGIIFLAVFSIGNITIMKEGKMSNGTEKIQVEEGYVPRKVPQKPPDERGIVPPKPPQKPEQKPKEDK